MKTLKSSYVIVLFAVLYLILMAGNVSADSSSKMIYLTFDADMTHYMQQEEKSGLVKRWYDPKLVEYLEKNNIPATFFVTGMFAEMYPDLIKRLATNPNFSIQNHTYDHRAFEPHCFRLPFITSDRQKIVEILKTQDILKLLIKHSPVYFRYPGLCHNTHDDSLVATEGLLIAHGEINSGDAYLKKPKAIVDNILSNINYNNVVVFHMGTVKSPETTKTVKLLIPKLKKLNYTFSHL